MVFERATEFPTTEEYLDVCPTPHSAYGFSKLAGEAYCRALYDEHGLPFTICRPFNTYGPGELPDQEPGIAHAVPDLIRKVLSGQRPLEIFGSGEQTRTFTHVDDVADGIVPAAFELVYRPAFEIDVQRRWPSVEKARRLLGWEARVDLREGIAATVEWLREHELAARGG
jgi:nucleoside-diphosphate-sugar epimerase